MTLILDVARFKYPPHWVPLKLLWDAMNTIDETTGQQRGYVYLHFIVHCVMDYKKLPLEKLHLLFLVTY